MWNIDDNLILFLSVLRCDLHVSLTEKPLQLPPVGILILIVELKGGNSVGERPWKCCLASLKVWPDVLLQDFDVEHKII